MWWNYATAPQSSRKEDYERMRGYPHNFEVWEMIQKLKIGIALEKKEFKIYQGR